MARAAAKKTSSVEHKMSIGLGDAISRLVWVEKRYTSGIESGELLAERELLRVALNEIKIDLSAGCEIGDDLNKDGIPDNVQFFELAATTGCCEIKRKDTSTRKRSAKPRTTGAKAKSATRKRRAG